MPYSRRDMVLSRYLLVVIGVVGGVMLYTLSWLIFSALHFSAAGSSAYFAVPMLATGFLLPSINLPFIFRYGVEKGRMFFLLFTVLLTAALGAVTAWTNEAFFRLSLGSEQLWFYLLPVLAAALLALSASVSVRIYERREF